MTKSHLDYSQTKNLLEQFSPTMCLAKWTQTLIQLNNGVSSSCCLTSPRPITKSLVGKEHLLHNGPEHLKERQAFLNGERPKSCESCWVAEDAQLISDRIQKSSNPWAYDNLEEIKNSGTSPQFTPSFLEISFSNVCQFRCSYCAPHVSSSIYSEIKKHGPYSTSDNFNSLDYFESTEIEYHHEDEKNLYVEAFWRWLPDIFPQLQVLKLTGGEPFLSQASSKLFTFLAMQKIPKHFNFHVNSNMGMKNNILEKKLDELARIPFSHPTQLTLISSLDGMGLATEFIRYGLDLDLWKKNLESFILRFPEAKISITSTLNVASPFELQTLMEFMMELKSRQRYKDQYLLTCYPLVSPQFLSLKMCDDSAKHEILRVQDWMKSQKIFAPLEIDLFEKAIQGISSKLEMKELNRLGADLFSFLDESLKRKDAKSPEQEKEILFLKGKYLPYWSPYFEDCLAANATKEILRLLPLAKDSQREKVNAKIATLQYTEVWEFIDHLVRQLQNFPNENLGPFKYIAQALLSRSLQLGNAGLVCKLFQDTHNFWGQGEIFEDLIKKDQENKFYRGFQEKLLIRRMAQSKNDFLHFWPRLKELINSDPDYIERIYYLALLKFTEGCDLSFIQSNELELNPVNSFIVDFLSLGKVEISPATLNSLEFVISFGTLLGLYPVMLDWEQKLPGLLEKNKKLIKAMVSEDQSQPLNLETSIINWISGRSNRFLIEHPLPPGARLSAPEKNVLKNIILNDFLKHKEWFIVSYPALTIDIQFLIKANIPRYELELNNNEIEALSHPVGLDRLSSYVRNLAMSLEEAKEKDLLVYLWYRQHKLKLGPV